MDIKKVFATFLVLLATGSSSLWGQCGTWTTSTIRNCNGIDYELWNQNNTGTASMTITGGSTDPNGGTFEASWNGTENILARAGKKWGSSSTTTARSVGNITLDFAATWTSSDNVKMLGVYGWAYYPSGSEPTTTENGQNTNFSNQIEYYIIQDRGSYNPASGGTNAQKYGEATIDGIAYEFWVADRINQPMLTGNGNFKQYFSVPKSTSSHRQSGIVTISKHFAEWDKAGMKMLDCPLYETAMKVESYTGSANGNGSAKVSKNLLTLGGNNTSSSSGGSSSSSDNTSLLQDGDFPSNNVIDTNDGASWKLGQGQYWGDSEASWNVSDGTTTIDVITVGTESYQPQLVQYGLPLENNNMYKLTFTASAATARKMEVSFQQAEDPWAGYASKEFNLTTTAQTYEFIFTMTKATDHAAQFAFNLGQATGTVHLSDVTLVTTTISSTKVEQNNSNPYFSVEGKALNVFPAGDTKLQLKIIDLHGNLRASFNATNAQVLPLENLAAGYYFVEITGRGIQEFIPIILE